MKDRAVKVGELAVFAGGSHRRAQQLQFSGASEASGAAALKRVGWERCCLADHWVNYIGVIFKITIFKRSQDQKGRSKMAKKRVFVSFDYDNDKDLKELLVGQARNPDSPFEVIDHSLKEAQPEKDWEEKAEMAIKRAEVFIVLLGSRTRWAPGVLKEVKIAQKLGKKKFQLIGPKGGSESWAVPGGGRTYRWTWPNLKNLLA